MICSADDAVARQTAEVLEQLLTACTVLEGHAYDDEGQEGRLASVLAAASVLGRLVGPEWSERQLGAILGAVQELADAEALSAGMHLQLIPGG